VSIVDPKNGKTKRKVPKLTALIKSIVSYNVSDNGLYVIGIQPSGDIFVWNKDTSISYTIPGIPEFAFKLGFHNPRVFISDDTNKIVLITSRNKVFVWEATDSAENECNNTAKRQSAFNTIGNWSDIVASKDIKTVEDNKELAIDVRFSTNSLRDVFAICSFVFNYENAMIVNVLKIKWLDHVSDIVSDG
jgi:hypothetical protein